MFIKALLFIIVLIYVYECYKTFYKTQEEYFSLIHKNNKQITENSYIIQKDTENNKVYEEYANTETINNNNNNSNTNLITENGYTVLPLSVDNTNSSQYKPMVYDPKRLFFWRRDILIPEGQRRAQDDNKELVKLKTILKSTTDESQKQLLQDEIDLYKWRTKTLSLTDTVDDRSMREIISDYFPTEIGLVRPWLEIHSHIPTYT